MPSGREIGTEVANSTVDVEVDEATIGRVQDRLQRLAGLDRELSGRLVRALVQAAADQALETAAGQGPVPSSVTAVDAQRAYLTCLAAERTLSQREIEVLFRTTASRARSVFTTMWATYAEALDEQFATLVKDDVKVTASGTDKTGLTWTLTFSELSIYELALTRIRTRGFGDAVDGEDPVQRKVVVRRTVERAGKDVDVLEQLGWRDKAA